MKKFRTLALPTAITMLIAVSVLTSAIARTGNADDFDAAATFKGRCVACHGAAAEKKFDATLADADLVQIVLKGKKPEKPLLQAEVVVARSRTPCVSKVVVL